MPLRSAKTEIGSGLDNLRVLALPSSGISAEKKYIFHPLEAAKGRWNWHIDLLSGTSPPTAFKKLAAPDGRFFTRPKLTERAAWEDDARAVAELDRKIAEAERVAGVPVAQIVLGGDAVMGRTFVSPVLYATSGSARWGDANDRQEINRVVRRLFHFADDMLVNSMPDLVYSYEWAKPWVHVVWLAAMRRGIPCVAVRRSKLVTDSYYLTADRLMFNTAARPLTRELREGKSEISDAAKTYIRSFRERPATIKYVRVRWSEIAKVGWLAWHLNFAKATVRQVFNRVRGRDGKSQAFVKGVLAYNGRILRSRLQQAFFRTFEQDELARTKYIYYPMHRETDLPLNFQAAECSDQRNTVRLLASAVPSGYRLFVREHQHNYGQRPSAYYRELARLPNVVLIDAFDSQFKYIANADLVVTENGSSGWEGLLLGCRVLTLSSTFYDGCELAHKLEDLNEFGATILRALSDPPGDRAAHDRCLGCMYDAEAATTFRVDEGDSEIVLGQISAVISPLLKRDPLRPMDDSTGERGNVSNAAPTMAFPS